MLFNVGGVLAGILIAIVVVAGLAFALPWVGAQQRPDDELEGESLECLYPSHHEFENIAQRGLPMLQNAGTYSDERIMRHRSGRLFWCHVAGRSMRLDQPFACAVWAFEDISARRPVTVALTAREREIARQLAAGQGTKAIARALGVSPRTIDGHRARLMKKLQARSAGEMIARLVGLQ